jgi:4-hydroxybenzoate polyprenyltransferase
MLVYLGLVVGLILIVYGFLSYSGSPVLASVPVLARKGDVLWLAGVVLLGIAALLGWVGNILGADLRLFRVIVLVIGLVLAVAAWVVRPNR